MSEIDRAFARFRYDKPTAAERHEQRTIPKRGTQGSRTVKVVHMRSGSAGRAPKRPRPPSLGVLAASWDDGFPARDPPAAFPNGPKSAVAAPVALTFHVMPPRSPSVPAAELGTALPDPELAVETRRGRGWPRKHTAAALARRLANQFDANDDGANCHRCGYLVEPARERRGLTVCGRCR